MEQRIDQDDIESEVRKILGDLRAPPDRDTIDFRVEDALDKLCREAPGEYLTRGVPELPDPLTKLIIKSHPNEPARSIKLANIRNNCARLLTSFPEAVAASQVPISGALSLATVAILVCRIAYGLIAVKLSSNHSFVVVAIYRNKTGRVITPDAAFAATNALREDYGEAAISRRAFDLLIDDLKRLECIDVNHGKIYQLEPVLGIIRDGKEI